MLEVRERSFLHPFDSIKASLMVKDMPNPAVYGIKTSLDYSLEETILPVAKRCLVKFIAQNAA